MGEFGAVYVVSGHIAGQTDTMPLRIEKLFQEYNLPGSFAVASVLTLLAILTLVVKTRLEQNGAVRRGRTSRRRRQRDHEHRDPERLQELRQLRRPRRRQPRGARRRRCWRCSGPSGSGKTTLLRIIAGLEVADCGQRAATTTRTSPTSRARDRNVGFVFQHYALFRHMTVAENIGFGLRVRGRRRSRGSASASHELLQLVRLEGLGDALSRRSSPAASASASRWPARWPPSRRVLLLDEPFGALDAKVRQELRQWLRRLHEEIHVTSIFVTHDQEEAFEVADRVVVMNQRQHRAGRHAGGGLRASGHDRSSWTSWATSTCSTAASQEGQASFGPIEVAYPDYPQPGGARRLRLRAAARARHQPPGRGGRILGDRHGCPHLRRRRQDRADGPRGPGSPGGARTGAVRDRSRRRR